jgi:hypothetical protein
MVGNQNILSVLDRKTFGSQAGGHYRLAHGHGFNAGFRDWGSGRQSTDRLPELLLECETRSGWTYFEKKARFCSDTVTALIGRACLSKFRIPERAPLFPIEKFLDGAARGVVMGEKNFGARKCPIDQARGVNEIADQRVEVRAGGQVVQAAPNIGTVRPPDSPPINCMLFGSDESSVRA